MFWNKKITVVHQGNNPKLEREIYQLSQRVKYLEKELHTAAIKFAEEGFKIYAIKCIRAVSPDFSLKKAKDFVDSIAHKTSSRRKVEYTDLLRKINVLKAQLEALLGVQ